MSKIDSNPFISPTLHLFDAESKSTKGEVFNAISRTANCPFTISLRSVEPPPSTKTKPD